MSQYAGQPGMRVQSPANTMMVGRDMPPTGQMPGGPIPTQPSMGYRRASPYGNVMLQRKQTQYSHSAPVNAVSIFHYL